MITGYLVNLSTLFIIKQIDVLKFVDIMQSQDIAASTCQARSRETRMVQLVKTTYSNLTVHLYE